MQHYQQPLLRNTFSGRELMTDKLAARLYRDQHWSVCEIAATFRRCTKNGITARLHRAGISGGVAYCPIHERCEELVPEAA